MDIGSIQKQDEFEVVREEADANGDGEEGEKRMIRFQKTSSGTWFR